MIVELLHHQDVAHRPDQHEVLLAAGGVLAQRGAAGLLERRGEQPYARSPPLSGPR